MKRLRKEKRTIPIRGIYEDKGKYFRCWNCGFICDSQRDMLSDRTGVCALGWLTTEDGIGVRTEEEYDIYPEDFYEVVAGCPFCGCTNYK